jgi:hypothetical protein
MTLTGFVMHPPRRGRGIEPLAALAVWKISASSDPPPQYE